MARGSNTVEYWWRSVGDDSYDVRKDEEGCGDEDEVRGGGPAWEGRVEREPGS